MRLGFKTQSSVQWGLNRKPSDSVTPEPTKSLPFID